MNSRDTAFQLGLLFGIAFVLSACYSFKGITIPEEINTFYIKEIENRVRNAPSDIGQVFSETLKEKFLNESKLTYDEFNPDLEFSGEITRYSVSSVAPQPGEVTAFNRLDISVRISYLNSRDEEDTWQQSFSFYSDYDRTVNLLDIQDQLIEEIFDQLVEDIFNKAFTTW